MKKRIWFLNHLNTRNWYEILMKFSKSTDSRSRETRFLLICDFDQDFTRSNISCTQNDCRKDKEMFSFLNERRTPFTNFSFCPRQYMHAICISRAIALSRWKIEQKVGACDKCKFTTGTHLRYDYSHSIRRIPSFGFPADNYGSLDTTPWTFASGFCCRHGWRTIEVFGNFVTINIQECSTNVMD